MIKKVKRFAAVQLNNQYWGKRFICTLLKCSVQKCGIENTQNTNSQSEEKTSAPHFFTCFAISTPRDFSETL